MLAYIGIGSNMGNKIEHCRRAVALIADHPGTRILRCSPLYETEPVGQKDQDWFVNGVIALETDLDPRQLLDFLLSVEDDLGRIRKEPWGPRVIDLDILFYGEQVIDEPGLQVPHPRIAERRFVLTPLNDIAAGLVHPLTGETIDRMLTNLPGGEKVLPLPPEKVGRFCSV